MIKKLLLIISFLSFSTNYSQDSITYFSDALRQNIKTYNRASNRAFEKRNFSEGQRLFDSLVQNKLIGTRFDDFTFKGYHSKNLKLNKIKKSVFIITYASWCVINKGDIPALNKLSKEHLDDIQIVVLFWDKKQNIKKIARQFSNNIKVCYANENYNNDSHIVATLKHALGFPMSYFIDENKNVVSINRIKNQYKPKTSFAKALSLSYEKYGNVINASLINKTKVGFSGLVTN